MAENKWEIDGHHYTCPACKKTMAIVVNESDEGLEFCPFCGKRMSSQTAEHNFDKLLGRNGELVEVRKKQVLAGALDIIQQHYADKQNKMEAVAQLFGKKLNEEFHFKVGKTVMKAKWTKRGLMTTDFAGRWLPCGYMPSLLTGQAVIVDA